MRQTFLGTLIGPCCSSRLFQARLHVGLDRRYDSIHDGDDPANARDNAGHPRQSAGGRPKVFEADHALALPRSQLYEELLDHFVGHGEQ